MGNFLRNLIGAASTAVGTINPALAPITGAISSVVDGITANKQHQADLAWQANQAQINRDFQRDERLETQKFNVDMWNANNKYNSPLENLERHMAAGYNPNDIIGSKVGSSSSAVTSSPMSGNMAVGTDISASMLLQHAQLANMQAQAQKTAEEAKAVPKITQKQLKKMDAEINELAARAGLTNEQADQVKQLTPLLVGKTGAEIDKLEQEFTNLKEQLEVIKANKESAQAQAELDKWKNEFRKQFGVQPNSGLVDSLIQLAVSGEKGANVFSSIIGTFFSVAKSMLDPKTYFKPLRSFIPENNR